MKPEKSELALETMQPLPMTAPQSGLSIEQVFQAVIDKKVSPENIEVMKQLIAMSAEQKFDEAFSKMQTKLPVIIATSTIPNRGKYEKFEDIMAKIQPILSEFGFSVSFENDFRENKIGETCCLSHGGHTKRHTYWTRPGGRSDSETQSDSKAATTARRNALIRALNLVIRQDVLMDEEGDPRLVGASVTPEQASELEHRLKMVNGDVKKFLEMAGAESFATIPAAVYNTLDNALRIKERAAR